MGMEKIKQRDGDPSMIEKELARMIEMHFYGKSGGSAGGYADEQMAKSLAKKIASKYRVTRRRVSRRAS